MMPPPHTTQLVSHRARCMGVFSGVVLRSPFAAELLNADAILPYPSDAQAAHVDAVMGWGLKPGAERARQFAERHHLRFVRAEDAFLRSLRLGVSGAGPIGICLDDVGMYYDARHPSRLEALIAAAVELPDEGVRRARSCIAEICKHGLSKYNWWPHDDLSLRGTGERVLVVDQTAGDLSIERGLASADTFEQMLDDALDRHPNAEILVKIHPDVLTGQKQGHLEHVAGETRVRLVAEAINPLRLLSHVDHVYTVTSQLGFEALMLGKVVHCYGMPFYAGWGLTDDQLRCARRGASRTLPQVFHAAYIDYARYAHPETGVPCPVETVIDYLAWQRSVFASNAGQRTLLKVPCRHRDASRAALGGPRTNLRFLRHPLTDASGDRVHCWSDNTDLIAAASATHLELPALVGPGPLDTLLPLRGSRPCSLVVSGASDRPLLRELLGAPSDVPDHGPRQEARRVAESLRAWVAHAASTRKAGGRTDVLFLGALDGHPTTARITADVRTLAALRERHPNASMRYVRSPGRRVALADQLALRRLGVSVIPAGDLPSWLALSSEIHTRSSVNVLWALIAGRRFETHGANWLADAALWHDPEASIEAMLVRWPRYVSHRTGHPTRCERVVAERLGALCATAPHSPR